MIVGFNIVRQWLYLIFFMYVHVLYTFYAYLCVRVCDRRLPAVAAVSWPRAPGAGRDETDRNRAQI